MIIDNDNLLDLGGTIFSKKPMLMGPGAMCDDTMQNPYVHFCDKDSRGIYIPK
jgi:hypothetical protein